jgi:hypothetical protein
LPLYPGVIPCSSSGLKPSAFTKILVSASFGAMDPLNGSSSLVRMSTVKQILMGPSVSSFQTAVDDVDIVDEIEFVLGLRVAPPMFATSWPPPTTDAHEEDEGDPASFLLSFDLSDWMGLVADLFLSFML